LRQTQRILGNGVLNLIWQHTARSAEVQLRRDYRLPSLDYLQKGMTLPIGSISQQVPDLSPDSLVHYIYGKSDIRHVSEFDDRN